MTARARLLILVVLALLGFAALANALPQQQGSVDLLNQADGQWDGPGEAQGGSATGSSVVGLGDIFHDGRAALAIGAPEADPGGRLGAGSVYVVAGQAGTRAVDLTALTGRGFRIDGGSSGEQLGFALASVRLPGGHPGLAIGAPFASPSGRAHAGAVYLIDLTRLRRNVDLSNTPLPRAVVGVLGGPSVCAESGYALAPGLWARGRGTTLLVGAPGADPSGCPVTKPSGPVGGNTGAVYAVRGRALTRRVDLAHPGAAAAIFTGVASGDRTGAAVAGVPGSGAVMIGAPYASPAGRTGAGTVYLLRGTAFGHTTSLAAPPRSATLFEGAAADAALGFSLATTTGFARGEPRRSVDLVLGAPQASPRGRYEAGAVYVLRGLSHGARVDLASAGGVGTIVGAGLGDEAGYSLAGIGSINGSGSPSLAIGAPFVNSQTGQDRIDNGAAYVLYGGAGSASVDLAHIRSRGLIAFGARNSDEAGTAVAGVMGENGDGRYDLLVGAPFAEDSFGASPTEGGAVYAVSGWGRPALRYPRARVSARVGVPIRALVPRIQATGRPSFSVTPALPRGLRLGRATGRITGVPRVPAPLTGYTVQMTDDAGVATATVVIGVGG